jgi:hypothetical protein
MWDEDPQTLITKFQDKLVRTKLILTYGLDRNNGEVKGVDEGGFEHDGNNA